jgi:hypothetical protein
LGVHHEVQRPRFCLEILVANVSDDAHDTRPRVRVVVPRHADALAEGIFAREIFPLECFTDKRNGLRGRAVV